MPGHTDRDQPQPDRREAWRGAGQATRDGVAHMRDEPAWRAFAGADRTLGRVIARQQPRRHDRAPGGRGGATSFASLIALTKPAAT